MSVAIGKSCTLKTGYGILQSELCGSKSVCLGIALNMKYISLISNVVSVNVCLKCRLITEQQVKMVRGHEF